MRYYITRHTAMAIRKGMPLCDVYLPISPNGKRVVAIDITIDQESIEKLKKDDVIKGLYDD